MIKTIKSVICNTCENLVSEFYTIKGKVVCAKNVLKNENAVRIENVYEVNIVDTHMCDDCFAKTKIKFNKPR